MAAAAQECTSALAPNEGARHVAGIRQKLEEQCAVGGARSLQLRREYHHAPIRLQRRGTQSALPAACSRDPPTCCR